MASLTAVILTCTLLAVPAEGARTPLDGEWQGVLMHKDSEAKVTVNFKSTADGVVGTMTMLDVGMFRQPLSKIKLAPPGTV
jgi:hypothetical protein